MAQYVVTDTELEAVASAIRAKGGTSADLEWYSGFTDAIAAISGGGGSTNILSGTDAPTPSVGSDGAIYLQTQYTDEDDSGLGWYAMSGAICKDTNTVGTINSRTFFKDTSDPALVAFFKFDNYWQARYASTVADGCLNRTSAGGQNGYGYSYVIDGVTWYFSLGNYGFAGSSSMVTTDYPLFEDTFDFTTQAGAEAFLEAMGVHYSSRVGYVIADSYLKVNGAWQALIGSNINDVNTGGGS